MMMGVMILWLAFNNSEGMMELWQITGDVKARRRRRDDGFILLFLCFRFDFSLRWWKDRSRGSEVGIALGTCGLLIL